MIGISVSISNVVTSEDKNYRMPLEMWLPFNLNKKNYWYVFAIEFFTIFHGPIWAGLFDLLFSNFVLCLCYEFDLLSCRMKNFINSLTDNKQNNKRNYELENKFISECVNHHNKIYWYT